MKSITSCALSFLLVVICAVSTCHGFFVQPLPREALTSFLHPRQAADLEACAYDLMKAAVKESRQAEESSKPFQKAGLPATRANANEFSGAASNVQGPLGWCRRMFKNIRSSTVNNNNIKANT